MISVIVPVFNVEAYLDRCVESIVGQSYRDLEIILVDDGSEDHSPQMCDAWAKKDERIQVIHQKNGGLSDARNAGVTRATGDYIVFVDSDDLIHPQMVELLYKALMLHHADVVECGFLKFSDYYNISTAPQTIVNLIELTPENALTELMLERRIHQIAWNKLYRKKLLAGVPFPVGKICEDEFWTYKILAKATKIVSFSTALYFYYQREGSIIHTYSLKRLVCIEAFQERLGFVKKNYPSLYPLANKSYLSACFYHFQKLCAFQHVDVNREARKDLISQFRNGDIDALFSLANWKYKIWYRLFLHFPIFTSRVRNLLKIGV